MHTILKMVGRHITQAYATGYYKFVIQETHTTQAYATGDVCTMYIENTA